MKAIFLQEGDRCDYSPATDMKAGDVVIQGELVGVAKRDVPAGRLGILHLSGIFKLEKAPGAVIAGQRLYWNGTAATTAKDDGAEAPKTYTSVGVAVWAAAADDTHALVLLNA